MDEHYDIPPEDYTIHKGGPGGDGGKDKAPPRLVQAVPYRWVDPKDIPPRQFLYGHHLIRGYVSVDVAGGGVGKTGAKIVETLSMISAKPLLGQIVPERLRVWLWNLEDTLEELTRRIQAACQHYGLGPDDLGDRLLVNGREHQLCITETLRYGVEIRRPVIDALIDEINAHRIDVINVDPFISCHTAGENDNTAIDRVVKEWGHVAAATNSSIGLTHHSRKGKSEIEIDADSSRGAKALVDAARSVRVFNRMTAAEGGKAGVENHRSYFRAAIDKANLTPPPDQANWYRIIPVQLVNGDNVGVVTKWEWPDAFKGVTPDHTLKVQKAIHARNCRKDIQSPQWVGNTIAEAMGLDPADKAVRAKVKSLLATWMNEGLLDEDEGKDSKGKVKTFVRVRRWVDWADPSD
jgi:hypothetical protein